MGFVSACKTEGLDVSRRVFVLQWQLERRLVLFLFWTSVNIVRGDPTHALATAIM